MSAKSRVHRWVRNGMREFADQEVAPTDLPSKSSASPSIQSILGASRWNPTPKSLLNVRKWIDAKRQLTNERGPKPDGPVPAPERTSSNAILLQSPDFNSRSERVLFPSR
jgi:hypothetical protein